MIHASDDDKLEHRRPYVHLFILMYIFERYNETAAYLKMFFLTKISRAMFLESLLLCKILEFEFIAI